MSPPALLTDAEYLLDGELFFFVFIVNAELFLIIAMNLGQDF